MRYIPRFRLLRSALIVMVLAFGLVPLLSIPVSAEHGGGGGGGGREQSAGGGGGGAPTHSGGKTTKPTKSEIAIPAPVAPQPPRLQGIQFNPDSRCAQLTAAQRRQTPGCGYN
jgi:hypothetical protein